MLKKITILDPFNKEKLSVLKYDELMQWLEIQSVSNRCKSGKMTLTKTFEAEFEFDLIPFVMVGLISIESCDDRFIVISDKLYLTEDKYNKLCDDFIKQSVDLKIKHFKSYKNKSKYSDAYRTLRKWLSEENKFKLSDEQKKFAEKSYSSYIDNTGCAHEDKLGYFKMIEEYFKHGYNIEEIRSYLKKKINEQQGFESTYVKAPKNVVKDFMDIKRLKG